MLTPSCTAALEMAALLLEVDRDDEVILPTFTFTSTATAFALRGARPVFADSRQDTLNLDESALEALITTRTKAIVVVHYGGVGCEMEQILKTAARFGLPVVEDNAHGLYGRYQGRQLGSFGILSAQSFHETKNFNCGEGGALLINDRALVSRAEVIREKGTNRASFFRAEVAKYTWVDQGSSYLLSELQAAYLAAQLEAHEQIQSERGTLWKRYAAAFAPWASINGVRLPEIPGNCDSAYHLFTLRLPTLEARSRLIAHLRMSRILAVTHYVPLHLSPMGLKAGARPGDCPVAEAAADSLLRLPLFRGLSLSDQDRVIACVLEFQT